MREMKDSGIEWIGEIPQDWKVKKIKNATSTIASGTTPPSYISDYYDGNIFWIQSGDLYGHSIINDTSVHVTLKAIKAISALQIYKADYIVIAMYGGSIGNIAISKIDACTNQACCVIKPSNDNNLEYMFYWFYICRDDFLTQAIGGGQPNISQFKIKNQFFVQPTKVEQECIASYLNRKCAEIDTLTSDIETQIETLEQYKRSVITEAVTKGLDPDVEMKNSGVEWIGEIPFIWGKSRIGYISWLRARLGWKGLKAEEYVDEGYPFLSAFNIQGNHIIWDNLSFVNEDRYEESPEIKLQVGDILLVKDGAGIGKCARIDSLPFGESTSNGSLAVITPYGNLNYRYLYYYFLSAVFQNYISRIMNGMGVPHLSQEELRKIVIPQPPINEQGEIADFLDRKCAEIDSIIADKRTQLDTLAEYKKSLIYEYVTGKKEVPSANEPNG